MKKDLYESMRLLYFRQNVIAKGETMQLKIIPGDEQGNAYRKHFNAIDLATNKSKRIDFWLATIMIVGCLGAFIIFWTSVEMLLMSIGALLVIHMIVSTLVFFTITGPALERIEEEFPLS